jgi:WD40 repeat protein
LVRVWPAAGGPAVKLTGHTDKVKAVAVSPDGRTLASSGKDGAVYLWDAADWTKPGRLLTREPKSAPTVAFGPDDTVLVGSSGGRSVTVWDRATGRLSSVLRAHLHVAIAVRAVPGRPGFVSAARNVALWERAASEPEGWRRTVLPGLDDRVRDVALSPDGRTLAIAADNGVTVWYWDGPLFRCRLYGHEGPVHAVAFHPDGRRLATAGADGTVRLWDLYVVPVTFRGPLSSDPFLLAYLPDRQVCVSGRSQTWYVQTWGNRDGVPPYTVAEYPGAITGAALAPDGAVLTIDDRGQVRRWPLVGRDEGRPPLFSVPDPSKYGAHRLTASPDGGRLAAIVGTSIVVMEAATGRRVATLAGVKGAPSGLVFAPGGQILAARQDDRRVLLWDATAGTLRAALPETGHAGLIKAVAFAPDGRTLATAGEDRLIRLWDLDGRAVGQFAGHRGTVYGLAFSPDGRTLASVGADGTGRLWQLATGRELMTFAVADRLVTHVAFSPDGRHLAFAGPPGPGHPFPGAGFLESHDCGWPLVPAPPP